MAPQSKDGREGGREEEEEEKEGVPRGAGEETTEKQTKKCNRIRGELKGCSALGHPSCLLNFARAI